MHLRHPGPTFGPGSVLSSFAVAASLLASSGAAALAAAPAASPRERVLLDAGWRFRVAPAEAGTAAGPLVENWRFLALPDGSAAPASPPAGAGADWASAPSGGDVFHGRVGFAWLRAELPAGPAMAKGRERVLHFGGVDDNATVFLNGKKLAHHDGWDDPFDVPIPPDAWNASGPNVLYVLVENTAGEGGITQPVTLAAAATTPGVEASAPDTARPGYNDGAWRVVHLPHDYVVEQPFDQKANGSHGFLPTPSAWYRKTFTIPAADRGRSLWIDFDGVYRDSVVWLNGHKLGEHPSGYTSFRYDITPYAHVGGKNVLAVSVNPRRYEGWWYEGGGIYRHVWLNAADPVHVAPWGTFVTSNVKGIDPTGKTPASVSARPSAALTIQTTLANDGATAQTVTVVSTVLDPQGKPVAAVRAQRSVPAHAQAAVTQTAAVPSARLWSLETPHLYRVHTTVLRGGVPADSQNTTFGIRTTYWDADRGFFLNGKPVKIQGVCNHQDFAGIGIAVPDNLEAWRVARLKEMGTNAWRMSHNPPTAELLDACDRLGMLVMDENRHLGDTYRDHTPRGTGYSDLSDLASLIQRDRNHPSVIMWSMCNEEGLQSTEEGARIFKAMMDVVHQYDTTRPISCAMNGGWGSGISLVEDLQGCNYNPSGYDRFHQRFPNKPMYGSETASAVGDRGIYADDAAAGYVNAYDLRPGGGWANTAEAAWKPIADRPFVAGGFVWTGFDYRGEPTPYGWPCTNSHFGILDLCGFPKDAFWYYKAWWGAKPVAHVFPHWNWKGQEGQPIKVWVYSNAAKVELFLNGRSLGAPQEMPRSGHLEWQVPYAPGTLSTRGYDAAGKVICTDKVETTGPPAALRLTTERTALLPDGEDLAPVAVAVVDAQGRVVPTADNLVTFSVRGAGHVAGVGNGDPSSHEPNQASTRHAFNGLCMVLVGAGETPGAITLTAAAPGLKPATLHLTAGQGGRP